MAKSVPPSDFFERKIRPIFAGQCSACHNAKLKTAGLYLSTAAGLRQGGTSGPIISKHDPEKGRLRQVLSDKGATKMPPTGSAPDPPIAYIAALMQLGP